VGQHNIIELNGKRYDAVTGAFLGKTSGGAMHKTANGRAVDGFIRTKPVASTAAKPVTAIVKPQTAKQTIKTSKKMDVARPNATLLKAHTPERPKTLMRRAVHKPTMSLKPAIKTQAPTELMAAPIKTIATPLEKKMSVKHVNPARLAHAKAVSKSQRVRRFSQAALQAPAARQAVAVPHVQQVARTMPATNTARPNAYLDLRRQQAQPTPRMPSHSPPRPSPISQPISLRRPSHTLPATNNLHPSFAANMPNWSTPWQA